MGTDSKQHNVPSQNSNMKHANQTLPASNRGTSSPKMAVFGGFAVLAAIGYTILYSHKKPEASAADVAKVASGTGDKKNTHPRK
ncbi:hypothetical protein DCAR_0522167 [Daucus carota subsp. sativus]|uniref:Uncharacterized protein n=1 Tax=Daucus carota subsp. sativus TaxID=79200 RepID=A0A164ZMH9_DAUCS|nr:hypothetical protein DCAR_0522167 [Daucus carota subsp. sativus]